MGKPYSVSDEIFLRCNKCKKILFKPLGAITHLKRSHAINCKLADIDSHFTLETKPPQDVIDAVKRKAEYQRIWRGQKRGVPNKPGQAPPPPSEIHYECSRCGAVVKSKQSAYGHSRRMHNSTASQVGFSETTKPITKRDAFKKTEPESESLVDSMPRIVSIKDSKVTPDGLLLTVEIQVATPFVAAVVLRAIS